MNKAHCLCDDGVWYPGGWWELFSHFLVLRLFWGSGWSILDYSVIPRLGPREALWLVRSRTWCCVLKLCLHGKNVVLFIFIWDLGESWWRFERLKPPSLAAALEMDISKLRRFYWYIWAVGLEKAPPGIIPMLLPVSPQCLTKNLVWVAWKSTSLLYPFPGFIEI